MEQILHGVKETMIAHVTENETRQAGMSNFVISTGNIKVSSWTVGMRQYRSVQNMQGEDKQEIGGEFCTRVDIS